MMPKQTFLAFMWELYKTYSLVFSTLGKKIPTLNYGFYKQNHV